MEKTHKKDFLQSLHVGLPCEPCLKVGQDELKKEFDTNLQSCSGMNYPLNKTTDFLFPMFALLPCESPQATTKDEI